VGAVRPQSETPVFTASVERDSLIIHQANKPAWVNDPKLEGGLWLRARSLLYIDQQVLPEFDPKVLSPVASKPVAAATAMARPTPKPTPTPKPVSTPTPKKVAPVIRPKTAAKPPISRVLPKPSPTNNRKASVPARATAKTKRTQPARVTRRVRRRASRGHRWRMRHDRYGHRYKAYY
jgi:hypothetical protein